jgi:hypothetical protein
MHGHSAICADNSVPSPLDARPLGPLCGSLSTFMTCMHGNQPSVRSIHSSNARPTAICAYHHSIAQPVKMCTIGPVHSTQSSVHSNNPMHGQQPSVHTICAYLARPFTHQCIPAIHCTVMQPSLRTSNPLHDPFSHLCIPLNQCTAVQPSVHASNPLHDHSTICTYQGTSARPFRHLCMPVLQCTATWPSLHTNSPFTHQMQGRQLSHTCASQCVISSCARMETQTVCVSFNL